MLNLPECTLSIKYTESAYTYSFDRAGDQTQGLMHARQVLYHQETPLALKLCLFFLSKQNMHIFGYSALGRGWHGT